MELTFLLIKTKKIHIASLREESGFIDRLRQFICILTTLQHTFFILRWKLHNFIHIKHAKIWVIRMQIKDFRFHLYLFIFLNFIWRKLTKYQNISNTRGKIIKSLIRSHRIVFANMYLCYANQIWVKPATVLNLIYDYRLNFFKKKNNKQIKENI